MTFVFLKTPRFMTLIAGPFRALRGEEPNGEPKSFAAPGPFRTKCTSFGLTAVRMPLLMSLYDQKPLRLLAGMPNISAASIWLTPTRRGSALALVRKGRSGSPAVSGRWLRPAPRNVLFSKWLGGKGLPPFRV